MLEVFARICGFSAAVGAGVAGGRRPVIFLWRKIGLREIVKIKF